MSSNSPTIQHWLTLILLSIIWGSSFILIKTGLKVYSGVQVGSLRIAITFLLFLPYTIRILKQIPRNKWLPIAGIGLLGSFFPAYLFAIAQDNGIESSVSGILNSLTPLFTYLWAVFTFGQTKDSRRLLGILLGLVGAVVVIYSPAEGLSLQSMNQFALLIVIATICYGLSGNIAKEYLQDINPVHITAVSFFIVGLPAVLILGTTDFFQIISEGKTEAWLSLGAIAILSIVGTAIALMLFWKLIQQTDPIFGSITTYLIPIVAILWGVWDGEQLNTNHYFGFVLIIISVLLVKQMKKK